MQRQFPERAVARTRWLNRWAGSYTFISCSLWGPQYVHALRANLGVRFTHTLFIHRRGTASFYVPQREYRQLGTTLATRSQRDPRWAKHCCNQLKRSTDRLLPQMRRLQRSVPTLAVWKKFRRDFERHLAFHVFVKKTIDFLPPVTLAKLLPYFTDARRYSELVYSESERLFRKIMATIAAREGTKPELLTCLTQHEFEGYLVGESLPTKSVLQQRYHGSVLYFAGDRLKLGVGAVVDRVETSLKRQARQQNGTLTGICAYPGIARGRARIVRDPHHPGTFAAGDILITGMTRPEFLPLIRQAAAIVTDVGGVLCHAAITARELKIPCVVGTAVATKVLTNDQRIMVDAQRGVVKVLR